MNNPATRISKEPANLNLETIAQQHDTGAMAEEVPDIALLSNHQEEPNNIKEALAHDLWRKSMEIGSYSSRNLAPMSLLIYHQIALQSNPNGSGKPKQMEMAISSKPNHAWWPEDSPNNLK